MEAATPEQQLYAYVRYLRDMGIYDLYARAEPHTLLSDEARSKLLAAAAKSAAPVARGAKVAPSSQPKPHASGTPQGVRPPPPPRPAVTPVVPVYFGSDAGETPVLPSELTAPMPKPKSFDVLAPFPVTPVPSAERSAALEALRVEIGDCTRCPLAYAGRHTIVFADGNPNADLMFVGEGPGADEDASGLPFVGKAGQLLNNMIAAMGVKREEVYIANIVKCRPPGNRAPEFTEATTCSQFLLRQIDIVQPKVIVALGKTAANYLLGNTASLTSQRSQWLALRGSKLLVTFHPAFLLRDPRQKAEAWKDLQMVMAELGLKAPAAKRPS
jgi:uracil-DNA glycosylase family 4